MWQISRRHDWTIIKYVGIYWPNLSAICWSYTFVDSIHVTLIMMTSGCQQILSCCVVVSLVCLCYFDVCIAITVQDIHLVNASIGMIFNQWTPMNKIMSELKFWFWFFRLVAYCVLLKMVHLINGKDKVSKTLTTKVKAVF